MYEKEADAFKAAYELRYPIIKGKTCRALLFPLKLNDAQNFSSDPPTSIFVRNLPKEWTHSEFHNALVHIGVINCVRVFMDKDHNSKRYSYINFASHILAKKALDEMDGHIFNGMNISISENNPQKKRIIGPKFTNLYVRNFPTYITSSEDLVSMFSKFGQIINGIIKSDEQGQSKGYGFVNFKEASSA
jgi:polyadenylate-binding protein